MGDLPAAVRKNTQGGWHLGLFLLALALMMVPLGACTGRFAPRPTAVQPPATATPTPGEVGGQEEPDPAPSATQTGPAATEAPSSTPSPSAQPSSTPTPFPITLEFSPTPSPEPLPQSVIQILSPGPLSKVVTPLHLSVLLSPGADGKVHVELLGEDGRLLNRSISQHTTGPGQRINLVMDLDYEIEAVAETGTLALSVDDGYGRTTDLASVEVILLNEGLSDINPSGDLLAPIILLEPERGSRAEGGELLVSGIARPDTALPLVIELVTRDGRVVGSRQVAVDEGPASEHRPFGAIITYNISEGMPVLMVVRERSDRFSGNTHIVSREILLSP